MSNLSHLTTLALGKSVDMAMIKSENIWGINVWEADWGLVGHVIFFTQHQQVLSGTKKVRSVVVRRGGLTSMVTNMYDYVIFMKEVITKVYCR